MAVRPSANGHLQFLEGGRLVWATDQPPIALIPDAWQEIPISIEYPDLPKDIAYFFDRRLVDGGAFPDYVQGYGMSIAKILPQELALPDVVLGTVPSALINYVDWRIVLTWTKKPSASRGSPVMSPIVRGKQTELRGGSAILEVSGGWRRAVHFALVGQDIVMRRTQSTRNAQQVAYNINTQAVGWTYGDSPAGLFSNFIDGALGHQSEYLGGCYRGGPRSASLSDNTDHSSIWTGTLLVKPGRANSSI